MALRRVHSVLFATGAGLRILPALGLFCGFVSIVSGVVLYSQHQETSQGSASEGVRASTFSSLPLHRLTHFP